MDVSADCKDYVIGYRRKVRLCGDEHKGHMRALRTDHNTMLPYVLRTGYPMRKNLLNPKQHGSPELQPAIQATWLPCVQAAGQDLKRDMGARMLMHRLEFRETYCYDSFKRSYYALTGWMF